MQNFLKKVLQLIYVKSKGNFKNKCLHVQFHNVVGGFSPPFERSGGVAGTELEGRA
jgi:hypothetical protein